MYRATLRPSISVARVRPLETYASLWMVGGASLANRADRHPGLEDGLLSLSETGTTPLFRPRLETVGLGWVNFQVFRRTNASLSRKASVDDKVSADQRGHGLGVSLGVYAISDLDQKMEAVRRLESEVIGQPDEESPESLQ